MAIHLITGGSGFLGNLIARELLEKGETIKVIDIWQDLSQPKEIEFVHCNVLDRNAISKAMKGVDIVHHSAALVPLNKAGKQFWEVNVEGSRITAEEAVKSGVKCFIHMSSSAIYGLPEKCPITSETKYRPIEIYGRAKLEGENTVRKICEKTQMPLIVVRPRTILGKGRLGIFQILFEWIREGKNIYVVGSGNIKFQFVNAMDLINAYMLLINKSIPGNYNIGTDRYGTLRETLENLISFAGTKSKVKSLPELLTINSLKILDLIGLSPLAPWHYMTYHKDFYFDVEPLLKLGWKPKYSNAEMMIESYKWFIEYSEDLKNEKKGSLHRSPIKEKILHLVKRFS